MKELIAKNHDERKEGKLSTKKSSVLPKKKLTSPNDNALSPKKTAKCFNCHEGGHLA